MTIPPSLPRDPTLSDRFDPRTRRFLDLASAIFNSWLNSGFIVQTGPGAFTTNLMTQAEVLKRISMRG